MALSPFRVIACYLISPGAFCAPWQEPLKTQSPSTNMPCTTARMSHGYRCRWSEMHLVAPRCLASGTSLMRRETIPKTQSCSGLVAGVMVECRLQVFQAWKEWRSELEAHRCLVGWWLRLRRAVLSGLFIPRELPCHLPHQDELALDLLRLWGFVLGWVTCFWPQGCPL